MDAVDIMSAFTVKDRLLGLATLALPSILALALIVLCIYFLDETVKKSVKEWRQGQTKTHAS